MVLRCLGGLSNVRFCPNFLKLRRKTNFHVLLQTGTNWRFFHHREHGVTQRNSLCDLGVLCGEKRYFLTVLRFSSVRPIARHHSDVTSKKRIVRFTTSSWFAILTPIGLRPMRLWQQTPTSVRWRERWIVARNGVPRFRHKY